MPATNLEVVASAYRICGIVDEVSEPTAEQGVVGLWRMNNFFADLARDGVNLGYYRQSNLAANSPFQESDLRGAELCLAGEIAGQYGITLSEQTVSLIDSAYTKLVKRTRPFIEANLSELPRAQGPYGWGSGQW